MGIWGAKIYDSDFTSDIRDSYQSYLASGMSPTWVQQRIYLDFADLFADPVEGPVAKLAMAELLWDSGALLPMDRDDAIAYIQSGGDLAFWEINYPHWVSARKKELIRIRGKLLSCMPSQKVRRTSVHKSFNWSVGEIYALPLSNSEEVKMLNLQGEYILIYIHSESEEIKGYRTPRVWTKITRNGCLPKTAHEFNQLEYIQIACTKMEDRYQPFASEKDIPDDFRQEYHPDDWGYLPEYTLMIYESRGNHPPQKMDLIGSFSNVEPPKGNYMRYRSGLGAAWKHVEEYLLYRYRLHNLRQAKFYH